MQGIGKFMEAVFCLRYLMLFHHRVIPFFFLVGPKWKRKFGHGPKLLRIYNDIRKSLMEEKVENYYRIGKVLLILHFSLYNSNFYITKFKQLVDVTLLIQCKPAIKSCCHLEITRFGSNSLWGSTQQQINDTKEAKQ